METLKHRIFKFDNVKFLAIMMIVIGNFSEGYASGSDMFRSWFVFIFSFNIPLFVFLAGLFQKKYEADSAMNVHRFTLYIILGFLLKLAIYGMELLAGENPQLDLFGGKTNEWFFFVIAAYIPVSFLLRKVRRNIVLTASVALGLAIGFFPVTDEFYLSRFLVFMPFYFAGYYLTPMTVRRFTHRLNVKLASIAFMFLYFVMCFRQREIIYNFRMLFTGRNPYEAVPIDGCSFYHRLLCYGISTVLIIAVISCMPNRKFPVVTHLGANTIGVYFWVSPAILLLRLTGFTALIESLSDPMWKLAVLASAVLLTFILALTPFSWPLKKLGALLGRMSFRASLILGIAVVTAAAVAEILLHVFV